MGHAPITVSLASVEAAWSLALAAPRVAESADKAASARANGERNPQFCGLPAPMAYDDLREWFAQGWPEGVARLRESMAKVAVPVVQSVRRRGRWADAGDELSRDRLYDGRMETMWRTTSRVAVASPTRVRILADICAHGGIRADDLFWRGASALALAEALVSAGYAVEIIAGAATSPGVDDTVVRTFTTVKGYDAPLNLAALAATVCSGAFFRTTVFALFANASPTQAAAGLGTPKSLTAEMLPAEPGTVSVVVGQEVLSQNAANRWVAATVAALENGRAA